MEKCRDAMNDPELQDRWGRAFLAGAMQALEWMRGKNGQGVASPSVMVPAPTSPRER